MTAANSLAALARFTVAAEKRSAKQGIKPANRNQQASPPAPRPQTQPQPPLGAALAAAIVRAGKVRRGEIADTPKPTGLAAQIIEAGRKRRGEIICT